MSQSQKVDNKEIIDRIAEQLGVSRAEGRIAFNVMKDIFVDVLESGKGFSIRDLGTFTVVEREARKGFNPSTNAPIDIPSRQTVKFKAATKLKRNLNLKKI